MDLMLDTNICIAILRGKPASVLRKLRKYSFGDIAISAITLAELEAGVAKSADPARNAPYLLRFRAGLSVVAFDDQAAQVYGRIRDELERKGTPIGPLDTLIAAHALSLDLPLVTSNEREFRRVPGLNVENWLMK